MRKRILQLMAIVLAGCAIAFAITIATRPSIKEFLNESTAIQITGFYLDEKSEVRGLNVTIKEREQIGAIVASLDIDSEEPDEYGFFTPGYQVKFFKEAVLVKEMAFFGTSKRSLMEKVERTMLEKLVGKKDGYWRRMELKNDAFHTEISKAAKSSL